MDIICKPFVYTTNATENSEVLAQTPLFQSGVWAGAVFFSDEHLSDFGRDKAYKETDLQRTLINI